VPSDSSGNGPPFFWLLSFRLHGCRRYDPKDGGGRIASGTAIESNAGAVAEAEQRKVARRRGRDPDSSKRRGSDSLNHKITHARWHSWVAHGNEAIDFKKIGLRAMFLTNEEML
jgi:hypothetical protein